MDFGRKKSILVNLISHIVERTNYLDNYLESGGSLEYWQVEDKVRNVLHKNAEHGIFFYNDDMLDAGAEKNYILAALHLIILEFSAEELMSIRADILPSSLRSTKKKVRGLVPSEEVYTTGFGEYTEEKPSPTPEFISKVNKLAKQQKENNQ